jgi:hypothetical protein
MRNPAQTFCWIVLTISLLAGCEEKFDLSSLPVEGAGRKDTSYVEITPPFSGFTHPQDVMIGNDQLLYVADTRGNRLVMFNLAGVLLSERSILHPVSIAQTKRLDLIVGGEIVASNGDTIGAIFRIKLFEAGHRLDLATIDTIWREFAHPARRFPGITVLPDNSWLAVRSGPDNSSFIDPDARVLSFNNNNEFVTPLSEFATRAGSGITDINFPTAIASFPNSRDFVLTQSSEGVSYSAIWMIYQSNPEFEGWLPKFDPAIPGDRGIDFIRPNRYVQPEGVTIDKARRDIFVADASLDSIFKFNSRGVFKTESFGKVRSRGSLRRPVGLAFFSKILYVLDDSSGVVLRFMLSTDVRQQQ